MLHKINLNTFNKLIDLTIDISKGIMGFGGVALFTHDNALDALMATVIITSGVILASIALSIDHKIQQHARFA